jgi:tetratricopeptide (TPR) repeat protein
MRQYDRAIETYRKLLGLSPNLPGIHCDIGMTLSQQGKLQEAVTELSQLPTPPFA